MTIGMRLYVFMGLAIVCMDRWKIGRNVIRKLLTRKGMWIDLSAWTKM